MTEEFSFRNPTMQLGFAQVLHVITLDPQVSDGAKITFNLYLMYAQQKGSCFPSLKTIAEQRHKDEATISRYNTELEKAGYITRKRRMGTTSLTIIEDVEAVPRLKKLATEILQAQRDKRDAASVIAPMQCLTPHGCGAKEEQVEEEQVEECANAPTRVVKAPSEHQLYFGALANALRIPLDVASEVQQKRIGKLVKRVKQRYTVKEIEEAGQYWWREDWRGKKNESPKDDQLVETLEKLRKQKEDSRWATVV